MIKRIIAMFQISFKQWCNLNALSNLHRMTDMMVQQLFKCYSIKGQHSFKIQKFPK